MKNFICKTWGKKSKATSEIPGKNTYVGFYLPHKWVIGESGIVCSTAIPRVLLLCVANALSACTGGTGKQIAENNQIPSLTLS